MGVTIMRGAILLWVAVTAFGQELPSANTIKLIQERDAHERAVAARIEYQISKQPKPAAAPLAPARQLSAEEARQLREALERYFRENPGVIPILWTPPAR